MTDIVFFHPMIRNYRVALFSALNKRYSISFIFTDCEMQLSGTKEFSHTNAEIQNSLNDAELNSFFFVKKRVFVPAIFSQVVSGLKYIILMKPKVVILTNFMSIFSLIMFLVCRMLGKTVIFYDLNWIYPEKNIKGRLFKPIFKWVLVKQKRVITAGVTHEYFLRSNGMIAEHVEIAPTVCEQDLPVGLSKDAAREEIIAKYSLDENIKIVLYLGRLVQYKGIKELVSCFGREAGDISGWVLLLGGDGPMRDEISEFIHSKNIIMLGGVPSEDRWTLLKSADIYVMPSKFRFSEAVYCEGWGLGINEAMSVGVPVIATDACGGAHEVITEEGLGGQIVPWDNERELSRVLNKLMRNEKLRKNLVQKGYKQIEHFTYKKQQSAFYRMLDSLFVN